MLFSGIPFLYYFLPVTLAVYWLVPKRCKNAVLLAASLFFYAWGEPKYLVLMVVSILFAYGYGLLIQRFRATKYGKLFVTLSILTSLGLLLYFKYADFLLQTIQSITNLSMPLLRIALPIGISFYTFQIVSYTVDVYRGEAPAQKNLLSFATYVALFPQLIAGPIVRYVEVEHQLQHRTHEFSKIALGIQRFLLGLAKKVLLANSLGEFCELFRQSSEPSVLFYWLYAIAFALQIYFDFSGYSDMAIGLGHMLGFSFPENFNYPFISKSITEFWRRWHMTLGSWFRDYVYISLGGNRVGKLRWLLNLLIVWMLTGLWHGAAWNFVLWGLFFAAALMLEKLWLGKLLERCPKAICHLYVILLTLISFVIFHASNFTELWSDLRMMFGFGGIAAISSETVYYLRSFGVLLVLALMGATPLPKLLLAKIQARPAASKALAIVEPLVLGAFFLICTAYLVDGSYNPFLYFRF